MLVAANHLLTSPLKNDGVKVSWDDDIPFPIFFLGNKKNPAMFQSPPAMFNRQWLVVSQRDLGLKMGTQIQG
jgi:hypothetical protein